MVSGCGVLFLLSSLTQHKSGCFFVLLPSGIVLGFSVNRSRAGKRAEEAHLTLMKRLPFVAVVLTLAGLLPFLFGACCIVFFNSGVPLPNLLMAFVFYGAICLSFWGAVQWGLALEADPLVISTGAKRFDTARLVLGVVPAVAGWLAAYLAFAWQPIAGVVTLGVAVPVLALVERQGWRQGALPTGYMGLRWIATAIMECCIVVVLLARLF